jgi:hypothetical protein
LEYRGIEKKQAAVLWRWSVEGSKNKTHTHVLFVIHMYNMLYNRDKKTHNTRIKRARARTLSLFRRRARTHTCTLTSTPTHP